MSVIGGTLLSIAASGLGSLFNAGAKRRATEAQNQVIAAQKALEKQMEAESFKSAERSIERKGDLLQREQQKGLEALQDFESKAKGAVAQDFLQRGSSTGQRRLGRAQQSIDRVVRGL